MNSSARLLSLLFATFALVPSRPLAAAGNSRAFVGSRKCGTCHPKEYASWKATRMGNASALLKPEANAASKKRFNLDPARDYTADAACVACHVTGYGKPGGFATLAATPDLAGIGCEVCHGPGEEYVPRIMGGANRNFATADAVAAGLLTDFSKERCTACHNATSPTVVKIGARKFVKELRGGLHTLSPLVNRHS